ncbi:GlsB/YeaQ/YmgE family stress response membrane protein [Flavobacteriaceae bacterium]|nr:GlsB/YeaQ/YmgE family stress response membrane protein [Flavobacteriaceae bacterium]
MGIIATIIIGAIAGWLGSLLYKGTSLGLLGNIVIGIVGSFVGGWLFGVLGISIGAGWVGAILTGAIGAIAILFIINLIVKKK